MTKKVSAYEARTKFGEIINMAYYQGIDIIVEKMGKPVVKITAIKPTICDQENISDKIDRFAGLWANKDGDKIEKYARELRKNTQILP